VTVTHIDPKPGDTAHLEVRSGTGGGMQLLVSTEIDLGAVPAAGGPWTVRAWQHFGCWGDVQELIDALRTGARDAFGPQGQLDLLVRDGKPA